MPETNCCADEDSFAVIPLRIKNRGMWKEYIAPLKTPDTVCPMITSRRVIPLAKSIQGSRLEVGCKLFMGDIAPM